MAGRRVGRGCLVWEPIGEGDGLVVGFGLDVGEVSGQVAA